MVFRNLFSVLFTIKNMKIFINFYNKGAFLTDFEQKNLKLFTADKNIFYKNLIFL